MLFFEIEEQWLKMHRMFLYNIRTGENIKQNSDEKEQTIFFIVFAISLNPVLLQVCKSRNFF